MIRGRRYTINTMGNRIKTKGLKIKAKTINKNKLKNNVIKNYYYYYYYKRDEDTLSIQQVKE